MRAHKQIHCECEMSADQKQKFLNELLGTHNNKTHVCGASVSAIIQPTSPVSRLDSHKTVLFCETE